MPTRNRLLEVKSLGSLQIAVSRPLSEREPRRIIFGVPQTDSEEDLSAELAAIGVIRTKRLTRRSENVPTPSDAVILTFNCDPPEKVSIAGQLFTTHVVKDRPLICTKCWLLGHSARNCRQQKLCQNCAQAHPDTQQCQAPPKCRNCGSNQHNSSNTNCPAYKQRARILEIARARNCSVQEAKLLLSAKSNLRSKPCFRNERPITFQSADSPPPDRTWSDTEDQISALKSEIAQLRSEMDSLKAKVNQCTPLEVTRSIQAAQAASHTLLTEMKEYVEGMAPIVAKLAPRIPYIEEMCNYIASKQIPFEGDPSPALTSSAFSQRAPSNPRHNE